MKIRVEVKNKLLGDSIFWEGDCSKVDEINNIPARILAHKVRQDGKSRNAGIWYVRKAENE